MNGEPEDRWQSHAFWISWGIGYVYRNKELTDVTLKINKQDPYKAHKFVLAARSPIFKSMLLDDELLSEEVVIEDECLTPVGCEILFHFIYTDDVVTEDKTSIIQAYHAARYFDQMELMSKCEGMINRWTITNEDTEDNVWQLLDAGYTIPFLKDKCITVIKNDVRKALSCPSFLKISCGCIDCLLESGVLRSVPAMDCLKRIMEWAAKRHTQPVDYKLVRQTLGEDRLGRLRLETLDKKELNEVMVNYKGLITPAEVVQFLSYSETNDKKSLPPWCVSVP